MGSSVEKLTWREIVEEAHRDSDRRRRKLGLKPYKFQPVSDDMDALKTRTVLGCLSEMRADEIRKEARFQMRKLMQSKEN